MKFFNRKNKILSHDTIVNDAKRIIGEDTPFAVTEAYRTLCTNVLYISVEGRCKKICVTSALSGEGKTSVSINFARTLSEHSDSIRVLLIDADMRKSRVSRLLPEIEDDSHGLTEYLAGIDKEPNIINVPGTRLSLITSGAESVNPAALLNSTKMRQLVENLEEKFDYIIFDTPPVNVVSDAVVLNEFVNGYLLVVRADYSDVRSISSAIDSLEQVGANIFGFVLDSLNLKYDHKYKKRSGAYGNSHSSYYYKRKLSEEKTALSEANEEIAAETAVQE